MGRMSAPFHLVIIGCGFGGLEAARKLKKSPDARITLVDRSNHHLFQPLLYQVATAGLSAPSIAAPIRQMMRGQGNVTTLMAEVESIDKEQRVVSLSDGQTLRYDALIVATGATHSYFGNDQWAEHAPGLKTLEDAFCLRAKILLAFEHAEMASTPEERESWLSFVIIGAGPTGVEMAGTMAEIARHTLKNEFRRVDPASAQVLLLEGSDRVLQALPPSLSAKAADQLTRLGVQVRTGARVVGIDGRGVDVSTNGQIQRIPARTVIWAAGVAASPLGRCLDVPLDRAGRVIVEPDLSIPGHPEVYVVGDMAAAMSHEPDGSTKPAPGVSPAAKQMGRHAAEMLLARRAGEATKPFRYRDYGSLATIGRKAAVADLGAIQFSGLPAWLFWLFVHIYFLIGFRSRLVVLLDWSWAYFSFQRSARVIAEQEHSPGASTSANARPPAS